MAWYLLIVAGGAIVTVILIIIIVFGVVWYRVAPVGTATTDGLQRYKDIQSISLETARNLFDMTVGKTLLPVFTTVLGYYFGSQKRG